MSNKIIKIALFTDNRGSGTPMFLKDEVDKSSDYWRVALAKIMEELPYTFNALDGVEQYEVYGNKLINGSIDYVKVAISSTGRGDLYYFRSEKNSCPYKVEIVEVDTTYPWQIKHYNGIEFIESLSNKEVINEDINLCRW